MQTGLIITAERKEDGGLNHFQVSRVNIKGQQWEDNKEEGLNKADMDTWVEIMVEGIITVIYIAHENKIEDSAKFLREVIGKLEQSFIVPADVKFEEKPKEIVATGRQEFQLQNKMVEVNCMYCQESFMSEPPKMCCSGRDCGCMGMPTEPVVCSKGCYDMFMQRQKTRYNNNLIDELHDIIDSMIITPTKEKLQILAVKLRNNNQEI